MSFATLAHKLTTWVCGTNASEREFGIDNLLVRIHFIIMMIMWTGLAPWEFEFPFPGSLVSTFPMRQHWRQMRQLWSE